ncbi:hypothetical protein Cde04nite_31440 [Cellulomonas denverensis]|nr:hypothetical protein Cde04nite_31440 [Cellulomonas denverensis]
MHPSLGARLDPVSLTLCHATEQPHDDLVSFRVRVYLPTNLWYPQRDPVVGEQGKGQAELVPVERALRLTDDNSVERSG